MKSTPGWEQAQLRGGGHLNTTYTCSKERTGANFGRTLTSGVDSGAVSRDDESCSAKASSFVEQLAGARAIALSSTFNTFEGYKTGRLVTSSGRFKEYGCSGEKTGRRPSKRAAREQAGTGGACELRPTLQGFDMRSQDLE